MMMIITTTTTTTTSASGEKARRTALLAHLEAVKLHCVFVGEAHDRRVRDIHPGELSRADVFRELLDVLGGDGRCDFELQDDGVVHLEIQTPDKHGHRA